MRPPEAGVPPGEPITGRDAVLDVAVVVALSAAYVGVEAAGVSALWVIPAIAAALAAYVVLVLRRRGESWRDYGVRADNLGAALGPALAWTALAAAAIAGWALARGASAWRPALLALLPLYPVWGFVQQLIFQGILHRRLLLLLSSRPAALVLTAAAFGLVHWGDGTLVVLTAAAGLVWSWLFQRVPNVIALGISHGILGALAYPFLLGRDPLAEL